MYRGSGRAVPRHDTGIYHREMRGAGRAGFRDRGRGNHPAQLLLSHQSRRGSRFQHTPSPGNTHGSQQIMHRKRPASFQNDDVGHKRPKTPYPFTLLTQMAQKYSDFECLVKCYDDGFCMAVEITEAGDNPRIDLIMAIILKALRSSASNQYIIHLCQMLLTKVPEFLHETCFERLETHVLTATEANKESLVKALECYWDIFEKLSNIDSTGTLKCCKSKMLELSLKLQFKCKTEIYLKDISEKYTTAMEFYMKKEQEVKQKIIERSNAGNCRSRGGLMMTNQSPQDVSSFRREPCTPNKTLVTQKFVALRKNYEKGAYDSEDDYLDVQFRLLREDLLYSYRKAIKVLRNKQRCDAAFYQNLCLIGPAFGRDGIAYMLQFPPNRFLRRSTKRLKYGNLLCLSSDGFKEAISFAVIADNSLLSSGLLQVEVPSECIDDFKLYCKEGDAVDAIESEAYFKPYSHVLRGMQRIQNLPFQSYIVRASVNVKPPSYLARNYDLAMRKQDRKIIAVSPLSLNWPKATDLGLNQSQMEAFKMALTKEFVIIQGPPGTGKTYVGLKIAKLLFRNYYQWEKTRLDVRSFHMLRLLKEHNSSMEESNQHGNIWSNNLEVNDEMEISELREGTQGISPSVESEGIDGTESNLEAGICSPSCSTEGASATPKTSPDKDKSIHQYTNLISPPNSIVPDSIHTPPADEEDIPENTQSPITAPMLVVCYTNHALDQFLEGMLRFCSPRDMLRVGGRSKSSNEELHMCNLKNGTFERGSASLTKLMKRLGWQRHEMVKENSLHNSLMMRNWRKLKEVECGLTTEVLVDCEVQAFFQEKFNGMSALQALHHWLSVDAAYRIPDGTYGQTSRSTPQSNSGSPMVDGNGDSPLFFDYDDGDNRQIDELDFAELFEEKKQNTENAETPENSNEPITFHVEHGDQRYNAAWIRIEKELRLTTELSETDEKNLLERISIDYFWGRPKNVDHCSSMLNALTNQQRWDLYRLWKNRATQRLKKSIETTKNEYNIHTSQMDTVRRRLAREIMESVKIIGMTTTGAARYQQELEAIGPQIIIIEEAAEVLEAHVVTALSSKCQHLILIGDHKQLKPNPTVYELAKNYNLSLSLFERMINNGIDYTMLKEQHRMRPEIAKFISSIYPELKSHSSTYNRRDLRGVASPIVFINHNQLEATDEAIRSKCNAFEADFVVALCNYLLQQAYKPKDIGVITMYSSQLLLIRRKLRDVMQGYSHFQGRRMSQQKDDNEIRDDPDRISINSVDNFQGEERKIIILSLVRSNLEGKLGFVGEENRVCVALSRARDGLFVFGNMEFLKNKSGIWKTVITMAEEANYVHQGFPIGCVPHGKKEMITEPEDFKTKTPLGGCQQPCGKTLAYCCHECPQICHYLDKDHTEFRCHKPCERKLKCGHDCPDQCYILPCNPCNVKVNVTIKLCGHTRELFCYEADGETEVEHLKTRSGGIVDVTCQVEVEHYCDRCMKSIEIPCWKIGDVQCPTVCKAVLPCGHLCKALCGQCEDGHPSCKTECQRMMNCGHVCRSPCCKAQNTDGLCSQCFGHCILKCEHGQECRRLCREHVVEGKHQSCVFACSKTCNRQSLVQYSDQRCPECKKQGCENQCGVPCTVAPCRKPCAKVQRKCSACKKADLTCLSVCGVECYAICRGCDKTKFNECQNLYGDEPFRLLRLRCKCVWKIDDLHTRLAAARDQQVKDSKRLLPFCPKEECKQPITLPSLWMYCLPAPDYCDRCSGMICLNGGEMKNYVCRRPCVAKLLCGHSCSGECECCFTNKKHVICTKVECKKILECGHNCRGTCADHAKDGGKCPPCKRSCIFKCEHGQECQRLCREHVVEGKHQNCVFDCSKTCNRQSLVQYSDQRCSECKKRGCKNKCCEPCTVAPCRKPCAKVQRKCSACKKADLTCLSVCGVECYALCCGCDKAKFNEYQRLYGDEPFRLLRLGCKCVWKIDDLHTRLAAARDQQVKDSKRLLPFCPKEECKKPINLPSFWMYCLLTDYCERCSGMISVDDGEMKGNVCRRPCIAKLSCGHSCSGECECCFINKEHAVCRKVKCKKILECGHNCRGTCADHAKDGGKCSPCKRTCIFKCSHKDEKPCLIPCSEHLGKRCSFECERRCLISNLCFHRKHATRCDGTCKDPCACLPCEEPCRKNKHFNKDFPCRCGSKDTQKCIAMCGEKCIIRCTTCHKKELAEQTTKYGVSGTRFIKLDCQHTWQIESLKAKLKKSYRDQLKSGRRLLPFCPVDGCGKPITSPRFRIQYGQPHGQSKSMTRTTPIIFQNGARSRAHQSSASRNDSQRSRSTQQIYERSSSSASRSPIERSNTQRHRRADYTHRLHEAGPSTRRRAPETPSGSHGDQYGHPYLHGRQNYVRHVRSTSASYHRQEQSHHRSRLDPLEADAEIQRLVGNMSGLSNIRM